MKIKGNNYTVYKHTTPSGKVYIGITQKEPEKRWLNGRGYSRNYHFFNAIKLYGWRNIKHDIIAQGLCEKDACLLEQRLIAEYDATDPDKGYNATSGGEHYEHTAATREKLSRARMGNKYNLGVPQSSKRRRKESARHADVRGEKNPSYGKKKSAEEIARRNAHRVYKCGGENPNARPILQLTLEGELVKRWDSITEAAQEFTRTSIKNCLRGKYKQHRGFLWRYESMNQKEIRSFDFEVRADESEEHGHYLTGRPIVYGVKTDLGWYDEIIADGALDGADLRDVRFLVNHNTDMIPLARSRNNTDNSTMQLKIVAGEGMDIRVDLDTERNAEANSLFSAVERGDITGMSFMFRVDSDSWDDLESEHPTRTVERIGRVFEVSACTFPAYEATSIQARGLTDALDSAKVSLESAKAIVRADREVRERKIKQIKTLSEV